MRRSLAAVLGALCVSAVPGAQAPILHDSASAVEQLAGGDRGSLAAAFAALEPDRPSLAQDSAQRRPEPPVFAAADVRATLDRYCVSCHNARLKTAELALDAADLNAVPERADVWEKVVRKLRSGTMPPQGSRRPD